MLTDIRYALRTLSKSPGFTLVAVLTLALGIGANASIFSVVHGLLLRPLPYHEGERLVTVNHFYPSLKGLEASVSAAGFGDVSDNIESFDGVAVQSWWQPTLTGQGDPERLTGARASGRYFSTLGVRPALGRVFGADEDQPGRQNVVVLSDGAWRRRFGADPRAVGQSLILDGEPHQIIGVMPPGFRDFYNSAVEMWRPVALTTEEITSGRTNEWLTLTARLGPGVTIQRAQVELHALATQLKRQYPQEYPPDWSMKVASIREKSTGPVRPALMMLFAAVAFVLLIACANVANLLLARAAGRSREIALRTALGAQRSRIVRQLLTESIVLALAGGVLGLLLAQFGVQALGALNSANLRGEPINLNGTVLAFTLALSVVTGLVFGLAPAIQLASGTVHSALREGGRGAAGSRKAQRVRRVLIVSEVALAVMLLTGAGLMIRSFARLSDSSPGFDPTRVLTFNLALPQAKYTTEEQQRAFFDRLLPSLASAPGFRTVGATTAIPMGNGVNTQTFTVEGYDPGPDRPDPWGDFRAVSPKMFEALRTPVLRGRAFTELDGPGAPPVVIVDAELARRYWPNSDPIGKRIAFGIPAADSAEWREVVGVVAHVKNDAVDSDARIQLYAPYRQVPSSAMTIAIRTSGDPLEVVPQVRDLVRSIDRDQPISGIRSMDDIVKASMGQRRVSTTLLTLFAGFALLIACIGLYGITAYAVTQQTREIGVRMALGAMKSQVVRPFVRDSLVLALIGLALGSAASFAGSRLLASQLYGVPAHDPVTLIGTAALLATVAGLASYLPARRASGVNPITALRSE